MSLHSKETHDFVKLLTSLQSSLRAFIVSLMPGSPDVQDVLQDVNVVIWEKMDSYEPDSDFRAWAFTICRNMVKAQFRKNKRFQSPALNEDLLHVISETWYHRKGEEENVKLSALDECMKTLKDGDRELVHVRYHRSTSLEDHATESGVSSETLRVTLFRIREKLRDCVQYRVSMEGVRS